MKYLIPTLAAAVLSLGWVADHYHGQAISWRTASHRAQKSVNRLAATLIDMQVRQEQLAQLDRKHTQELADAHHNIDVLQRDVDAGRQRLQLHAICSAVPAGKTTGTTRVDDGARARPTDAAQRDYFTLRKRIETAGQQIAGLQDYITTQCLR